MDDLAVIDRPTLDALLESFGGDREFFGEMLDSFFADSPRQLDAIRGGLDSGDCQTVRTAAHSLKSNCRNFGSLVLSDRCKELELLAKGGSLEGGTELLAEIRAGYVQVQAALETIRARG